MSRLLQPLPGPAHTLLLLSLCDLPLTQACKGKGWGLRRGLVGRHRDMDRGCGQTQAKACPCCTEKRGGGGGWNDRSVPRPRISLEGRVLCF